MAQAVRLRHLALAIRVRSTTSSNKIRG